jgi:hypothetical protein
MAADLVASVDAVYKKVDRVYEKLDDMMKRIDELEEKIDAMAKSDDEAGPAKKKSTTRKAPPKRVQVDKKFARPIFTTSRGGMDVRSVQNIFEQVIFEYLDGHKKYLLGLVKLIREKTKAEKVKEWNQSIPHYKALFKALENAERGAKPSELYTKHVKDNAIYGTPEFWTYMTEVLKDTMFKDNKDYADWIKFGGKFKEDEEGPRIKDSEFLKFLGDAIESGATSDDILVEKTAAADEAPPAKEEKPAAASRDDRPKRKDKTSE